ncbi:putative ABC transporter permease [Herbivorax sp. ANBcel31]|uniref:putative ABC transporter permease n=1 Tax=Herbivorax sp. ANBcel31 TaxID=3069754 RepID=UPI0027B0BAE3|nr:putative ABC transporter permease [Herbivorax sp. ANBcel31]MDQ2088167.1 putative ABC transporter permease [Herbivorax sp. ANBcel31]
MWKHKKKLSIFFLEFVIYSFIGWLYETILTSIALGRFVNRGVLSLPLCPIYGFFCLFLILIFSKIPSKAFTVFIISTVVISILEYLSSVLIEIIFNELWWDYSHWTYNLHGRISLYTSVGFGLASVLLIKFIHPKLYSFFNQKVKEKALVFTGVILCVSILIDTYYTFLK